MPARVWHATVAGLVIVGMVLQAVIAVRAPSTPPGQAVGTLAGAGLVTRVIRVLSFFTIQSNILAAVTSAQLARHPDRDGPLWRPVRIAALIGIAVTGVVYTTVLARVHEPHGADQVISNAIFHYVVPLLTVLGWLLFGPRRRAGVAAILRAAVWPVAWLAYTLIHGDLSRWYPYPFLDVASHGYGRVAANAVGVLVLFVLVAGLLEVGDRRLPPAPRP